VGRGGRWLPRPGPGCCASLSGCVVFHCTNTDGATGTEREPDVCNKVVNILRSRRDKVAVPWRRSRICHRRVAATVPGSSTADVIDNALVRRKLRETHAVKSYRRLTRGDEEILIGEVIRGSSPADATRCGRPTCGLIGDSARESGRGFFVRSSSRAENRLLRCSQPETACKIVTGFARARGGGGTGRRKGLKIPCPARDVRVRFPPSALHLEGLMRLGVVAAGGASGPWC
jgi:hypothetical protein